MHALAEEELPVLAERREALEKEIQLLLLPKDAADERSVILEIVPGPAGRRQRCLPVTYSACTSVMHRRKAGRSPSIRPVRARLAATRKSSPLSQARASMPPQVRVRRSPRAARARHRGSSGRIHTSAATVAVLPEAQDVDIDIKPEDIPSTQCAHPVPVDNMSTRRIPACASLICRRAPLWCRPRNPSTRTGHGQWKFCVPDSTT